MTDRGAAVSQASPVPVELLDDPTADCYAIAAYAAIRSFCDAGQPHASIHELSERAGCSDRSFRKRRAWLRDRGWIEWIPSINGGPNTYIANSSPGDRG